MPQDWFKGLSKKKKVVSVFVCNGKAEEAEKSFSPDFSPDRAESDKGSFFNQEKWLKEFNEKQSAECDSSVSTSRFSASRSKHMITVEEPLADLESENTETWQKLYGHAIIASERLQEKINKSVTCCFCQGSVELVETLRTKNGLGSTWMFQCQNKSCLSQQN